ncbi:MAG: methyltransferase type 12, partial [Paenibacillaceae bacterium]|nr:methyltransferase type 12 [Paenibacillaceae bacterium]
MTGEAYGQFAYYYDRLMADHPYDEWIRYVKWCWDAYGKPETVVDLGCGTGTLALMLAKRGCRVMGIDASEDMLAIAQSKQDRSVGRDRTEVDKSEGAGGGEDGKFGGADGDRGDRAFKGDSLDGLDGSLSDMYGSVQWLQQDMREWELPEPVDCVVSFCDCLNYLLEEEDVVSMFARTFQGLKPGGLFLFDVHTPFQLEAYSANEPFVLDEDDIAYIWTCDYDPDRRQIEHELTIFVQEQLGRTGGAPLFRRIEETHVQRAYPLDWLKQELARAGFGGIGCFADFTREPVDERAGRAFFAARKL